MAFDCNYNVIILSNQDITWSDCIKYIKDNLYNFRENSKILILYGIHGTDDGEIGEADDRLKILFEAIPRKLKKKYPEMFEKIKIEMVDIGNHMNRSEIDQRKLVKSIREKDHTIIFLAFCYTNTSVLNDLLRSAGYKSNLNLLNSIFN